MEKDLKIIHVAHKIKQKKVNHRIKRQHNDISEKKKQLHFCFYLSLG